jgi:hypothetical protein
VEALLENALAMAEDEFNTLNFTDNITPSQMVRLEQLNTLKKLLEVALVIC